MTDPDDRCGMGDIAILSLAAALAAGITLVAWRWLA